MLLEQILKEELLVMKLNRKILVEHKKLVSERQDWYSIVAEEYMKLEQGEDFDSSVIEEGVWSKIKYYMAKLPNLEKGGKIFGRTKRTKEAAEKLEAAIAKAAEKGFGTFKADIEKEYPEFPNMENQDEFLNALMQIGEVYDSLEAALKKNEIDAVSANSIVDALREYVSYLLDYELSDTYKHFNEGQDLEEAVGKVASTAAPERRTPRRTGTAGGGGAPEDPDAPKGKFTKRGAQGDAVDSATLAGLASNKLPVILGLTGAAAVLAGLFAASPQALAALKKLRGLKNVKQIATGMQKISKTFGPADNEGFTQMVGRLTAGNPNAFGPNTDPNVFFKAVKSLGIDPTNPTQFFQLGADQGAYTQAIKSGAKTLGEMFPASNKDFYLDKGAQATSQIAKSVTKNLGSLGAGGGAAVAASQLAAASTLASTLGIGLATAGAAVKLIRMKGQKSSRAQLLQDLSKELQPFDVPEKQTGIDPPVDVTPAPSPEPENDQQGGDEQGDGERSEEPKGYEKPKKPYEFPLMDVENAILDFVKKNGMKMSAGDVEDLVGEIESWMQSARERGADYFDIEDTKFMQLKESENTNDEIDDERFRRGLERAKNSKDIVQRKGKAKLSGYGSKRKRYKTKDPRIAIKTGGSSRRTISLARRLHQLFSIGNDQGRHSSLKGLNNKQLKQLKKAIVDMVYKQLSSQGPLVKQEEQIDPLLERWQKIAGINKKVL